MIYDTFCYFNEDDMLDLRLNYLKDIVDKFIIIEANITFSGLEKKQNFKAEKYDYLKDKIIYVYLENMPESSNPWFYENYQRNYALEVLKNEKCNDDDIVIISDLDEIPSISAIEEYRANPNGVKALSQNFYNLYLNLFNVSESPWRKAKILTYKDFFNQDNKSNGYDMCLVEGANDGISPTSLRLRAFDQVIQNGGWHFSYIGDADFVITKIKSFAHQEFNNEFYLDKERIQNCFKECSDILARKHSYVKVDLDHTFPPYILEKFDQYKKYILD